MVSKIPEKLYFDYQTFSYETVTFEVIFPSFEKGEVAKFSRKILLRGKTLKILGNKIWEKISDS